jgi:lysozyme family protein
MAIDDIIAGVIAREGGYSDRAADRGGPTCWGITQATLNAWRGRACTAAEVAQLGKPEAAEIYRRRFVVDPHFDRIQDQALQEAVIDAGVNHGQARPVLWLQAFLGLTADGGLGPISLAKINAADARELRRALAAARVRFYGRIIADDARTDGRETQADNAGGWLDRAAHWIEQI